MLMIFWILVMSLNLNPMPKIQTKLVMLLSPKMSIMMLPRRRRKQLIPIIRQHHQTQVDDVAFCFTRHQWYLSYRQHKYHIAKLYISYRWRRNLFRVTSQRCCKPSGYLEIVKDAEFKYKLQNVHFKEELFNTI